MSHLVSSRSSRRSSRGSSTAGNDNDATATYASLMQSPTDSVDAARLLSDRLQTFRQWLKTEAQATVHPALCVVNGEATDGTRNAPVLVFDTSSTAAAGVKAGGSAERLGAVDGEAHLALYDRTMGCQIRTVREVKKDEVIYEIPRAAMVTPDLVAASDAGKAVLACCQAKNTGTGSSTSTSNTKGDRFWQALENTTLCEQKFSHKVVRSSGPQNLVKILKERKEAEQAFQKHLLADPEQYTLAPPGTVSTRAPLLAFLIHQRFSDSARPPVATHDFNAMLQLNDGNALAKAVGEEDKADQSMDDDDGSNQLLQLPPGAPDTFAPYVRTLPSSVSLPLGWERKELAVLTGCLPGLTLLQEVSTSTMQLAAEFVALLRAGILQRFPHIFPEGLLTWERWVWAASMVSSRTLPAQCYGDQGMDLEQSAKVNPSEFQSPVDVWNELGVMIPLLDMLNHEVEANQVTWQPVKGKATNRNNAHYDDEAEPSNSDDDDNGDDEPAHGPRAIVHKKVRKGSELFTCYGLLPNHELIKQYGFAMMNNASDQVRMGWGLSDGVGNCGPPHDYVAPFDVTDDLVFESNDEKVINAWWSQERISLLKQEALSHAGDSIATMLENGKKLVSTAFNDGTYDPILLTVAVIATMPVKSLRKNSSKIVLSSRHQVILQRYLEFIFSRKMEKLLQNLDTGLKGHFPAVNLWTKCSSGGLEYDPGTDMTDDGAAASKYTSWQSFFDTHAYRTAMEVEKHYYSLGTDSCVLTLYDGQLRALHHSMTGITSDGQLAQDLREQLSNLGFELAEDENGGNSEGKSEEKSTTGSAGNGSGKKGEASTNGEDDASGRSPRLRRRRKNRNAAVPTGNRPPALKLHIGNLSYQTTPSDLYDYFCNLYGEENVLECHIPTERDTGRSRGFGFVAMPEEVALQVLQAGKKHEVGGRAVKIAKSNSVGSGNTGSGTKSNRNNGRAQAPPPPASNDRCKKCGYRPKYCSCAGGKPPSTDRPPAPGPYGPGSDRGPDRGSDRGSDRGPDRAMDYGRPPPRSHEYYGAPDRYREDRYRDYRYDDYDRYGDYDRDRRSHRYGESPSRSYGRSDERRMRRDSDRSRERSSSRGRRRDYDDDRGSRRDRRSDDSYDRDRKRSRSRSRERSRKKKSKRRSRSPGSP